MASTCYEAIDRRQGRLPVIRHTDDTIAFEMSILGGVLREELFVPTPRTRLVLRCDRAGELTARILEGRSSGA